MNEHERALVQQAQANELLGENARLRSLDMGG